MLDVIVLAIGVVFFALSIGCRQARVAHKPRLLSDNGSSYVSGDLAKRLTAEGMGHVRGAPCHRIARAGSNTGTRR
jgi:hypothetical protein